MVTITSLVPSACLIANALANRSWVFPSDGLSRAAYPAIHIELPEVKITVEDGYVVIRPLLPLRSRDLVLEAMLMAGEAAARFVLEREIPFPFTTQDPPDTDERPEDMAGMFALRRTLKPSQYKSVPGPHAGLGLEVYAQVTSPLRRYLDLVAHQQLRAHLRGESPLQAQDLLERVGAAAALSQDVRRAERLARRHWTLVYLKQNPEWQGGGILVDKRDRRGRVLIPELDLEAQVHLRQDLPLNSPVSLVLKGVNLAELEAYLSVVG
jgi:exoribonuclease-2